VEPDGRKERLMMEETETDDRPLLHDPPCVECGHAAHPYLVCGNDCDCAPTLMPGQERVGNWGD
jgi:hypothetical protein